MAVGRHRLYPKMISECLQWLTVIKSAYVICLVIEHIVEVYSVIVLVKRNRIE